MITKIRPKCAVEIAQERSWWRRLAGQASEEQRFAGQALEEQRFTGQAPEEQGFTGQKPKEQGIASKAPKEQRFARQHSSTGETGSPMSLIDRLIADEAMRMLSQVASSNETTTLNEPCEQEAVSTPPAATTDNSSETPQEVVVIVDDSNSKTTDQAAAAAAVRAADSALLQKSAEQVTKKLLNQLTTMSKYDLKQMIDNPAGKYETALNRHAQSKLRAEVRKQLKCIGLSNELGKTRENGTSGMEADEAIDAEKIPTALLQQIGQALDLDLLDYVAPEPKLVDALEQATSNDLESIKVGDTEVPAGLGVPSGATNTSFPPMTISCVQSGAEVQPLPLFDVNYQNELQQGQEIRILPHAQEGAEEMLNSSSLPSECTQPAERIPSPQSMLNTSSEEYILGDEDEERYIAKQAMETQTAAPVDSAKLKPLLAVTEQMQSIDAQTVELFNRKMQIDTTIMNLNAERMEIDQQLVKLQHIRGEQMNFMRACLQELGPAENMQPATLSPVVNVSAHPNELPIAQQPPVQQQQSNERTIRRITPIGGNSVLMSIFQRRRVPSERSTEENQAGGDRT
uniref:Uncharacterized protein n=1 Tax=Anopheles farauti TaxID=69004 RepID=A0A182QHH2_9DIPT